MPTIHPIGLLRTPNRIVESAWLGHGPFAFWIVDQLRPRLIVELGSHNGYSFCCFCEQMRSSGIDGKAIAIDTWQGDEHSGPYAEAVYENLSSYVASTYPGLAALKRMYFSEALASVADGTVDLLHVDGRHYYEDVVEDYTTWIPKLSDRAVVLFHDTQVRERGFGVYKYWAELEKQHPTFEFHHSHGLGVLGFGSALPASVTELFRTAADPAGAAAIRLAFAHRGAEVEDIYHERARGRGNNALLKAYPALIPKVARRRLKRALSSYKAP